MASYSIAIRRSARVVQRRQSRTFFCSRAVLDLGVRWRKELAGTASTPHAWTAIPARIFDHAVTDCAVSDLGGTPCASESPRSGTGAARSPWLIALGVAHDEPGACALFRRHWGNDRELRLHVRGALVREPDERNASWRVELARP